MSAPQTAACGRCGAVYWLSVGHACATTGPVCPGHSLPLSGGPVLWHCPHGEHGHGITAADLVAAWELAA